mmetsp:Transcript_45996/g.112013  ORF Transcript_45996/g.112013 Transcript_45996/m.112013 type:complete len:272 (-) Transcript_45996:2546-3361(-)
MLVVAQRLAHRVDEVVEVREDLLLGAVEDDLGKAEAHTRAHVRVGGGEAALENRNHIGKGTVAHLADQLAHGAARDGLLLEVPVGEAVDEGAHERREDRAQGPELALDYTLPYLEARLAHARVVVGSEHVDGREEHVLALHAKHLADLGLAALVPRALVLVVDDAPRQDLPVAARDLGQHVAQQVDRRRADAPEVVEEALLDRGQHERHGRVSVVRHDTVASLERHLTHGLHLVGQAGEDGGKDLRDEGLKGIPHALGQGGHEGEVTLADV